MVSKPNRLLDALLVEGLFFLLGQRFAGEHKTEFTAPQPVYIVEHDDLQSFGGLHTALQTPAVQERETVADNQYEQAPTKKAAGNSVSDLVGEPGIIHGPDERTKPLAPVMSAKF